MTALEFAAVALAGGCGAALRLALDAAARARTSGMYPVGTVLINVLGSFLLGLVVGLSEAHGVPAFWQAVVGVGLMGGFTTFSTISVETVSLMRERRYAAAAVVALGLLGTAVLAAWVGIVLGVAS